MANVRSVEVFNDGWALAPVEADGVVDWEALAATAVPVTLPHTWNAVDGQDGGNDYRRGRFAYLRRMPTPVAGATEWLELRGVNSSAEVYLGGDLLATHHGGYSTFRVELPSDRSGNGLLAVVADNRANTTVYPQRADFTFYGGVYRDLILITVGPHHFALDGHGGPGLVVTPHLDGSSARVVLEASVVGGEAVRFTIDGVASADARVVGGTTQTEIVIDDVRRWHGLRDPYLYVARAELLVEGVVVDEVALRFGCREFSVDPDRGFILNGEAYPLRGVSRHQDWLGVGNAITQEMMDTDLALIRELGATSVRLAHYQHDQYFYDRCDEAGIVVWAEIPQITSFMPGATQNATDQLVELIVQNRHHASIVCWGLSNEITLTGSGSEVVGAHEAMNALAHRLDPMRPTAMAHLFMLETDHPLVTLPDLLSYNLYFGWYVGELTDNEEWLDRFRDEHPGVAVGLSEYGADANPRLQTGAPTRTDYTEQYQAVYHDHLIDVIEARPWLWSTYMWNMADFGADARDEGGTPGRNQKGLVTFDRSLKKDAFFAYKAAWSSEPFVHVCGRRYVDRAEDVTEVTVYSNQSEVSLWRDTTLIGTGTGRRSFRFRVELSGEHTLTARSGDLSDAITVRRVSEPNPDYSLSGGAVMNWFDAAELPTPDGHLSIQDTMGTIKQTAEGRVLVEAFMDRMAANRGEIAEGVEMTDAIREIVDRMTFATMLNYAGDAVTADEVGAMNAALNRIPKPL